MRRVLSWLGDPTIHIAVVLFLVFRVALTWGGEDERGTRDVPTCVVCRSPHTSAELCQPSTFDPNRTYQLAGTPR